MTLSLDGLLTRLYLRVRGVGRPAMLTLLTSMTIANQPTNRRRSYHYDFIRTWSYDDILCDLYRYNLQRRLKK